MTAAGDVDTVSTPLNENGYGWNLVTITRGVTVAVAVGMRAFAIYAVPVVLEGWAPAGYWVAWPVNMKCKKIFMPAAAGSLVVWIPSCAPV
jgi:hypothetical protein